MNMIVFPRNRTISVVSGSISIAVGLVALVWPAVTAEFLALLVGVFLVGEALFSFLSRGRGTLFTWTAVAQGVVGLFVALFLVLMPGVALRVLVMMIAVWIVIRAGVQLWTAFQFRNLTGVPMFVGLFGGISLLVGILLISRPEAGIIAFAWLIGIYAIVSGVLILMWGLRSNDWDPSTGERRVGPDV
ncbi:MAG: HdeD family acid-resistance protein [Alkalispirochaeta sp.]